MVHFNFCEGCICTYIYIQIYIYIHIYIYIYVYLHVNVELFSSSIICWKNLSFLHWIVFAPLSIFIVNTSNEINFNRFVGAKTTIFFSLNNLHLCGSIFGLYSAPLIICLVSCQYHSLDYCSFKINPEVGWCHFCDFVVLL
jgi:hypothetical protein